MAATARVEAKGAQARLLEVEERSAQACPWAALSVSGGKPACEAVVRRAARRVRVKEMGSWPLSTATVCISQRIA